MCIQIYAHLWMQIYIHMRIHTYIYMYVYTCAKSLQSCSILCNPMDCSPPDFSVHGFSKQEYWSVLPCSPPGGIASTQESNLHLMSLVLTGIFFTTSTTWEVQYIHTYIHIYTQVCVCVYIYIYRERERERENIRSIVVITFEKCTLVYSISLILSHFLKTNSIF